MAVVISKCRQTGNHAFLAVEVNPLMLERSGGPFTSTYCAFCDSVHCWYIEDSRLVGRPRDATAGLRGASGSGSIYR